MDIETPINEVVEEYISKENVHILAVTQAGTGDISSSQAHTLAR